MSNFQNAPSKQSIPLFFNYILFGESISFFGAQIFAVMVPLIAVLHLDANEVMLGLMNAFIWIPVVLFGLIAGSIADKLHRWKILAICNLSRAILVALVPIFFIFGALDLGALITITFFVASFNVFFDIAYQTYVPELVSSSALSKANSGLELARSTAQLVGPLLGGFLAVHYQPEYLIFTTSLTFIIAFGALFLIPKHLRISKITVPSMNDKSFGTSIIDGLRLVFRTPLIRSVVMLGFLVNIFVSGVSALFVLFVTKTLGLDPSVYGVAIALSGLGAIFGAFTYQMWSKIFSEGTCVIIGVIILAVGTLMISLTSFTELYWIHLSVGQLLIGYGSPIMNIALVTLRQKITPPELLGRVNASARMTIMSSLPLGALVLSGFANYFSTEFTMILAACCELFISIIFARYLLTKSKTDV